ncbi:MAG TPA: [Fe-Fe] hydrogenase large subunit C-terminal domain-containing protein [Patescibacteria group bacterium]|nr:[Fe-Fe] hydrogenase large subunit C-terminal domain-containing protein [Patescibacteria group bacterium]
MNEHQNKLLELLNSESKVYALLAPAFPIDFPHPQIVGMLKELGFEKVAELTFGARMVNYWYKKYIEENPNQKYYIASPCPMIVNVIEKKYPELRQYLIPVVSPMHAMINICRDRHPDYKMVFVSPCQAKRALEAPRFPGLVDIVITFKELSEMLEEKGIKKDSYPDGDYAFDSFITEYTKVYPISGGLAKTAHVRNFFKPEEICIVDGIPNYLKIFDEMKAGISPYRFIDVLNCVGGCVGGPDIKNKDLPLEEKDRLVIEYRDRAIKDPDDGKHGDKEYAEHIDMGTTF